MNERQISDFVDGLGRDDASDARLAVSIGVACSPADGTELTELLLAADAALYRAKDAGRNRVMVADRHRKPAEQRVGKANERLAS